MADVYTNTHAFSVFVFLQQPWPSNCNGPTQIFSFYFEVVALASYFQPFRGFTFLLLTNTLHLCKAHMQSLQDHRAPIVLLLAPFLAIAIRGVITDSCSLQVPIKGSVSHVDPLTSPWLIYLLMRKVCACARVRACLKPPNNPA